MDILCIVLIVALCGLTHRMISAISRLGGLE
jgi:hypothetical protein